MVDKIVMKTLKTIFSFLILTTLLVSCGADKLADKPKTSSKTVTALGTECGGCTREMSPVCGSNGITYENACVAGCYKVTSFAQGNCECSESLMVCVQNSSTMATQTMSECEARNELLDGVSRITKFVPCDKAPM